MLECGLVRAYKYIIKFSVIAPDSYSFVLNPYSREIKQNSILLFINKLINWLPSWHEYCME
jgi:hypothetical protein